MARAPRFDAAWQRRRRWRKRWPAMRLALVLAGLAALVWSLQSQPTRGGEWEAVDARFAPCGPQGASHCAIDGDTLAIGRRHIRLAGYDAPELDGACEDERQLARDARAELLRWANTGPFQLDGGTDPPRDRYGRELRHAMRRAGEGRREEWLAEHMLDQGLARRDRRDAGWCDQG